MSKSKKKTTYDDNDNMATKFRRVVTESLQDGNATWWWKCCINCYWLRNDFFEWLSGGDFNSFLNEAIEGRFNIFLNFGWYNHNLETN